MQQIREEQVQVSVASPITIDYADLQNNVNLNAAIEQSFGPKGLGILFVKGIPGYLEQRKLTLPLFERLGNLPQHILAKYERPQIFHSQGWSCGKEKFQGQFDVSKGSYYVNCVSDFPTQYTQEEKKLFNPQELKMNVGNLWVDELPQIQKNVKSLYRIMVEVGGMLAVHIDRYVKGVLPTYEERKLEKIVKESKNHTGRILHYFPFEKEGTSFDDWCGWHNDHGSLTALTSAMYLDKDGNEVQLNSSKGGLYAKNRFAQMARILIPKDVLAFQIGQSMQIHSGGRLQATPHCVVKNNDLGGKHISRNTFALFMQPNFLYPMTLPKDVDQKELIVGKAYKVPALKDRWDNGILFKEFHTRTLAYYS